LGVLNYGFGKKAKFLFRGPDNISGRGMYQATVAGPSDVAGVDAKKNSRVTRMRKISLYQKCGMGSENGGAYTEGGGGENSGSGP